MPEEIKEEVEEKKPEKKGLLQKAKDAILPDADEQAAIISTAVRMGVLVWSGGILTLNYVAIPGVPQQKIDPTFIASVFTGVLASFGIQTASKKGDGTMKMNGNGNGGNGNGGNGGGGTIQTIRIEQMPLKIIAADIPPTLDPKKNQKPPTV
jgi:hypothetical protein|tara:strand:- start:667 stop:1122 length:456 start_codon:yes stop_codon:yes gene_type:complete